MKPKTNNRILVQVKIKSTALVDEFPIKDILRDPNQPRQNWYKQSQERHLMDMAESIHELGQMDEVIILKSRNGKHRLVNGETRLRAIEQKLNGTTIKAKVIEFDSKDQLDEDLQFRTMQATTNFRTVTPPVEGWAKFVAEYYRLLSEKYHHLSEKEKIAEILYVMGKRSSCFYRTCELIVNSDSEIRDFVEKGIITPWTIWEISRLSDEYWQKGFTEAVRTYGRYKKAWKEEHGNKKTKDKMITFSPKETIREVKHIVRWAKETAQIISPEDRQQFAYDVLLCPRNLPGIEWQKAKYASVYKDFKQNQLNEETEKISSVKVSTNGAKKNGFNSQLSLQNLA